MTRLNPLRGNKTMDMISCVFFRRTSLLLLCSPSSGSSQMPDSARPLAFLAELSLDFFHEDAGIFKDGCSFATAEAVSKAQIRFGGKAQADETAQHTWEYVSILKRLATQPLGLIDGVLKPLLNISLLPALCRRSNASCNHRENSLSKTSFFTNSRLKLAITPECFEVMTFFRIRSA
jgi:hypothetical protein